MRPAIDEMLTIDPAPVAERAGKAAREQRNAPPRWMLMTRSQSASESSSDLPGPTTPATFASASRRPNRSTVAVTIASTDSVDETSPRTPSTRSPDGSISPAALIAPASSTSLSPTR